jgi:hypothetical protein
MTLTKQQKILIVTLLLVMAAAGYYFFFSGTSESLSVGIDLSPATREVVGEDVLVLVEQLKKISVDPSLFSSPIFLRLKDFTVPILPEAQGRSNPFAEIGADTAQTFPSLRISYEGN